MFKTLFVLLLAGHVLGDFYFQNDFLAKKKETSLSWLLLHGLFYWLALLLVCLPVMTPVLALAACAAGALHLAVDGVKTLYGRRKRRPAGERGAWRGYLTDQLIHLFCIAAIAFVLAGQGYSLALLPFARRFLEVTGWEAESLLAWFTVLLLLYKPANISIAKFLSGYRAESPEPEENAEKAVDKNAGRIIGVLERLVIIALLSLQQYAAIGLVLTAKSIARYDRISKEPAFAEYYLLGTLLSTLAAILLSFLL